MGRIIRDRLKELSFLRNLLFYTLLGVLGVAALTELIERVCNMWIAVLMRRYAELIWQGSERELIAAPYNGRWLVMALYWLETYGVYFLCFVMMILVVCFYYRQHIYPAVSAVAQLHRQIQAGDYLHPVSFEQKGELGELCGQVEAIRQTLLKECRNRNQAWEEQRKVNAAFAHDIRTPLTVMKGYTDFLIRYLPTGRLSERQVLDKIMLIEEQEQRLYAFSNTMAVIHQLDNRTVHPHSVTWEELLSAFKHQAEAFRGNTQIAIELTEGKRMDGRELFLDMSLVMEAVENIWNNALRYADNKIEFILEQENEFFMVHVRDDGPGFSQRALLQGADAYFREETKGADGELHAGSSQHFGLGLAISRILCERHGGSLTMVNSVDGGAIVTTTFRCL